MKRFLNWFAFIAVMGLIIWGLVAAEKKATREEANLPSPDAVVGLDHTRGAALAPVTLIEYGDFQCPACRTYHPIVEKVIASTSPQTLRFVFRHFPLTQHGNAMPAAQAFEAAGQQGKLWEMYDILYERQPDWETSKDAKTLFVGYAKELGLDEAIFLADFDSKDVKDKINNDYKGGVKAGINSTPTFYVNGKKIASPQSYDEFKKIIDDAVPKLAI